MGLQWSPALANATTKHLWGPTVLKLGQNHKHVRLNVSEHLDCNEMDFLLFSACQPANQHTSRHGESPGEGLWFAGPRWRHQQQAADRPADGPLSLSQPFSLNKYQFSETQKKYFWTGMEPLLWADFYSVSTGTCCVFTDSKRKKREKERKNNVGYQESELTTSWGVLLSFFLDYKEVPGILQLVYRQYRNVDLWGGFMIASGVEFVFPVFWRLPLLALAKWELPSFNFH